MQVVTELIQSSQSKNLNFFEFSRVFPGSHPLTKKPEDSGYEIALLEMLLSLEPVTHYAILYTDRGDRRIKSPISGMLDIGN